MIYFTSDLHAFHKNIIEFDDLPFKDLKEYREHIITVWNDTISEDDEVYLLGDTAVGGRNRDINEFLQSLNGKKYLVKGNHEKEIMKVSYLRENFEWIKDYYVFDYNKTRFVLMHFPIEEWINKRDKSIHLHGHSHGKLNHVNETVPLRRIDVGFKSCGFKIYSIDEIIQIISKRCQK
jgi:calcineurin-like phosphoesterase family protein